jgi:hypothetical protein
VPALRRIARGPDRRRRHQPPHVRSRMRMGAAAGAVGQEYTAWVWPRRAPVRLHLDRVEIHALAQAVMQKLGAHASSSRPRRRRIAGEGSCPEHGRGDRASFASRDGCGPGPPSLDAAASGRRGRRTRPDARHGPLGSDRGGRSERALAGRHDRRRRQERHIDGSAACQGAWSIDGDGEVGPTDLAILRLGAGRWSPTTGGEGRSGG